MGKVPEDFRGFIRRSGRITFADTEKEKVPEKAYMRITAGKKETFRMVEMCMDTLIHLYG